MKNIMIITLALITYSTCVCQIMLEKSFDEGELLVGANAYYDTADNPEYLITFNSEKQTLNFYNEDYSLYKSLTNIFDGNQTSCMPSYLTRKLFNSDSKLEFLAYMIATDGTISAKIINEDGEVLKDFGAASSVYCIKIKNKIKLLVNAYELSHDSGNPGIKYTSQLFSVPGNLD